MVQAIGTTTEHRTQNRYRKGTQSWYLGQCLGARRSTHRIPVFHSWERISVNSEGAWSITKHCKVLRIAKQIMRVVVLLLFHCHSKLLAFMLLDCRDYKFGACKACRAMLSKGRGSTWDTNRLTVVQNDWTHQLSHATCRILQNSPTVKPCWTRLSLLHIAELEKSGKKRHLQPSKSAKAWKTSGETSDFLLLLVSWDSHTGVRTTSDIKICILEAPQIACSLSRPLGARWKSGSAS